MLASAGETESEGLRRLILREVAQRCSQNDKNQQVLQERFHLGCVSLEITPGFK